MLSLNNLKKTYRENKNDFSLNINQLDFGSTGMVFILGKSGCGKSTLLNLIGLIDTPDSGEITIDNFEISKLSIDDKDIFRANHIGYVFQNFNLFEDLTVKDNVALSLDLVDKNDISVGQALQSVGLLKLKNRKISQLSGGQKQRVALARSICKKNKFILCDEPTGSLDKRNAEKVMIILKELSRKCLVIVVSHNTELAKKYADSIIEMADGKIISNSQNESGSYTNLNSINIKNNKVCFKNNYKNKFSLRLFKKRIVPFVFAVLFSGISYGSLIFNYSIDKNNYEDACAKAISENNSKTISLKLINSSNVNDNLEYSSKDFEYLNEQFDRFDSLYVDKNNSFNISQNYAQYGPKNHLKMNPYFTDNVSGFIKFDSTLINDYGFELISGTLPQSENEILITEYRLRAFEKYGYSQNNFVVSDINKNNIVGKTVSIGNVSDFVISGVINTFDFYRDFTNAAYVEYKTKFDKDMNVEISHSMHNAIFVNSSNTIFNNLSFKTVCVPSHNDLEQSKILYRKITDYSRLLGYDFLNREVFARFSFLSSQIRKCEMIHTQMNSNSGTFLAYKILSFLISISFSILYISSLIRGQFKDFGILRCLGVHTKDIYGLLNIHSLEISLVFSFTSIGISFVALSIINGILRNANNLFVNLYSVNFVSCLFVFGLIFLLNLIITSVNMLFIRKKKPVELMKG